MLGDGLELREAPQRDAAGMAAPSSPTRARRSARTASCSCSAATTTTGSWRAGSTRRLQTEPSGFLGLAEPVEPAAAGPLAARLAELARPATLRLAYPGVWLRDDVYAIHGHYLDLHSTVPTFERLAAGAMARWVVRLPADGARPDDYEAALAPIYAFLHQLTQRSDHAAVSAGASASARAWVALSGDGRRPPRCARALRRRATRARSARLNALGLGPVDRDLSAASLRRGGLHGMREVLRRLGVTAPLRAVRPHAPLRPVAGRRSRRVDDARRHAADQHRLMGPSAALPRHGAASSPYWPGTAVLVEDDGPAAAHPRAGGAGRRGICDPGREARGVAGHARPDPQVEHARRVVVVAQQRVAARPVDAHGAAVDRDLPCALEHGPHRAGLVRAGVGPG